MPATKPVTPSAASAETGTPTTTVRIIARTTAPAARGCSDRNARAMKTKGISARPNAMNGPAAGASASSDTAETRPTRIDQYAGTRTSVDSRIARHLRLAGRGSAAADVRPRQLEV